MDPAKLGPYSIVARLGRGGMGTVYEAVDTTTNRKVAVKELAPHIGDDDTARRRFRSEIEALKKLDHPGIVRILAYGEHDGRPFFAMELVRGRSLDQFLRAGRTFSAAETVAVAGQVARALKYAHDTGMIHRDLKPANLLVLERPLPNAAVKLADFGIAKCFGDTEQTLAGTVVGTPEYMSPEQAAGRAIDHRTDLYSLGLVMFAMLTGQPPFRGGSPHEVMRRQQHDPPVRVSTLAGGVPPALDELIDQLLAKDPAARPPGALMLLRRLSEIAAAKPAGTTAAHRRTAETAARRVDPLASTKEMTGGDAPVVIPSTPTARGAAADGATRADDSGRTSRDLHRLPTAVDASAGPAAQRPRDSFTTVEADRRRARAEKARRETWALAGRASLAVAIIAGVGAGGSALVRPLVWPTADEVYADILEIHRDPDDLRNLCPLIVKFLKRFPADPRVDDVRKIGRAKAVERLELRSAKRLPNYRPMSDTDREYLAAYDLMNRDPREALRRFRSLRVDLEKAADSPVDRHAADPCAAADSPDAATWLALVDRQIQALLRHPLPAAKSSAETLREEVLKLDVRIRSESDPAGVLVLREQRHGLLERIVDDYADDPDAAEVVAWAVRLLEEDR